MAIIGSDVYVDQPDELRCGCEDPDFCPGTCDYCGFKLCPDAEDIHRCDGKGACNTADNRGRKMLAAYRREVRDKSNDDVTVATDIFADLLRALPVEEWSHVVRTALMHAHEETYGEGSAKRMRVTIRGLKNVA